MTTEELRSDKKQTLNPWDVRQKTPFPTTKTMFPADINKMNPDQPRFFLGLLLESLFQLK